MKLQIELEVSEQFLKDVFLTNVEGACHYWARVSKAKLVKPADEVSSWFYAHATFGDHGDNTTVSSRQTLEPLHLLQGIKRIICQDFNRTESHAHCHASWSASLLQAVMQDDSGMIDYELADLILQATYFGHIVYG